MKLKYIGHNKADSFDDYILYAKKELTKNDIKLLLPSISTGCKDADEDMHDYNEIEILYGNTCNIVIITTVN